MEVNTELRPSQCATTDIHSFFPRSYFLPFNNTDESFHCFQEDFARTQILAASSFHDSIVPISDGFQQEAISVTQSLCGFLAPLQQRIDGSHNIWILKPGDSARGVGIYLFDNATTLLKFVSTSHLTNGIEQGFVVQKYVETPFTIFNKKFDIRQFVLVTSLDPLIIFMFRDCYLRFCTKNFSVDHSQLVDQFVHLTNHQVQKNSILYNSTDIEENQWSLATFRDYLRNEIGLPYIWEQHIHPKIQQLVVTTLMTWPKSGHREYSFELLGFDILLNEHFDPFLLEINTNPGLHMLTKVVRPHHTKAQHDLLKVVLDHRNVWKNFSDVLPESESKQLFGDWQLIFHEHKPSLFTQTWL